MIGEDSEEVKALRKKMDRFTPARDGREGKDAIHGQQISREKAYEGLGDPATWKADEERLMREFKQSPSPVQPQPGWRALDTHSDVLKASDQHKDSESDWLNIPESWIGLSLGSFDEWKCGSLQFRRREGGERKGALTIEDAQEKRVCRICQVDDRPRDGNPLVLKYGEEYAHEKCIEQHPEFPPVHRVSDCQGCNSLRARLAEVERDAKHVFELYEKAHFYGCECDQAHPGGACPHCNTIGRARRVGEKLVGDYEQH